MSNIGKILAEQSMFKTLRLVGVITKETPHTFMTSFHDHMGMKRETRHNKSRLQLILPPDTDVKAVCALVDEAMKAAREVTGIAKAAYGKASSDEHAKLQEELERVGVRAAMGTVEEASDA